MPATTRPGHQATQPQEGTMHQLTTATAFAAREAGALAGHEVRCSCGFVARTSLSAREATRQGQAHAEWAARTGR